MTFRSSAVAPRQAAILLALSTILPFVIAAGGAPSISGVDPVAVSPFHDPVAARTAEFEAATASTRPAPAPAPEPEPGPKRLATVRGVDLYSPSPAALAHGFHEGSTQSVGLEPVGEPVDNPRGIDLPKKSKDGVRYVVMPSRGRAAGPTSAVDVAMDAGVEVASPVTGTVLDVSNYALYGRTNDVMVRIRPEQNPDVLVVVFHVVDPAVGPGDEVVAGETPIAASARPLPFSSQVDRWAGKAGPHVHIQVDPGA